MTDVLGQSITVSEVPEASGRGVALLALESLGILPDLAEVPDFVGTIYQPDMRRHECYRKAIKRQKALYKKLVSHKPFLPSTAMGGEKGAGGVE